MDLKEVNQFDIEQEKEHWWIQTRFLYVRDLIVNSPSSQHLKEFGCGTCQNLWYVRSNSDLSKKVKSLEGIDLHWDQAKNPDWFQENDQVGKTVSSDQSADVALLMDVLEHVDDEKALLEEIKSNLNEGGRLLVTVPAFMSLWSYHDEFLDHKRRYTKSSLLKIMEENGFQPIKCHYIFSYLFPVVYLVRKVFPEKRKETSESDLKPPPFFINGLLKIFGKLEKALGGSNLIGTSVAGVFEIKNV